jgi:hypothetical protein
MFLPLMGLSLCFVLFASPNISPAGLFWTTENARPGLQFGVYRDPAEEKARDYLVSVGRTDGKRATLEESHDNFLIQEEITLGWPLQIARCEAGVAQVVVGQLVSRVEFVHQLVLCAGERVEVEKTSTVDEKIPA